MSSKLFLPDAEKNRRINQALRKNRLIHLEGTTFQIPIFHQKTFPKRICALWHTHPTFELSILRKGRMCYFTRNLRIPVDQGEAFMMTPTTSHRWDVVKPPCIIDSFLFDVHSTGLDGKKRVRSLHEFAGRTRHRLRPHPSILKLLAEIDREAGDDPPYSSRRLWLLTEEIILLFARIHFFSDCAPAGPSADFSSKERYYLERMLEIIDRNTGPEADLGILSVALGLSKRYVNQIFTRNMGMPCHRFVQERKLMRAHQQVTQRPDLKIREIAQALGYQSESYFTRVFSKKFGFPPSRVRSQFFL
ncbi:MAG: helix-turn-helix transcriptional regulator [Spirochaetia bacterium]|nr:helix-turn-helix transcriptional regulator [Spirochaetia bacterium]